MINHKFKYIAFFDVDETVISIKSMFSFLKFYSINLPFFFRPGGYLKYRWQMMNINKLSEKNVPRNEINIQYYRFFHGVKESSLRVLGNKWHMKCLQDIKGFYNQSVLKDIAFHKSNGAKIVLVSGSFFACLEPIAAHIQADYILATSLEIVHGECTGEILNYPVIGEGKAQAIRAYLDMVDHENYNNCYAYGDHISDLPMLNLVGNPIVVANCAELIRYAHEKNWPVIYSV